MRLTTLLFVATSMLFSLAGEPSAAAAPRVVSIPTPDGGTVTADA